MGAIRTAANAAIVDAVAVAKSGLRSLFGTVEDAIDAKADAEATTTALGTKADKSQTITGAGLAAGTGTFGSSPTVTVTAASDAETIEGSITNKAVTPHGHKAAVDDRLAPIDAVFVPRAVASRNLYDPTLAAATGFGQALNLSGGLTVNANFCNTGLIPVTAGHSYNLTIRDAPAAFVLTLDVFFYNSDRTLNFHGVDGVDVFITEGQKTALVPIPSGVAFVGFNTIYFGGLTANPTATDAAGLRNRTMMVEGQLPDYFQPYVEATDVTPVLPGGVTVVRNGDHLYIRDAWSTRQDKVEKFSIQTPGYGTVSVNNYDSPGMAGPEWVFLIPAGTDPAGTVAAADAAADIYAITGDDAPPLWVNNLALGGNHGFPAKSIPATAHGKTTADVGSRWNDGAGKEWVIVRVVDANNLIVVPRPGGTSTSWTVDTTLTGTTLTHVAGATHTGTINHSTGTDTQLYPWAQNQVARAYLDGIEITANGVYRGEKLSVVQTYGIPNAVAVIDAQIARAGSLFDPVYNSPSYQTQVNVSLTWTWRPGELTTVAYEYQNVQAYAQGQVVGMQAGPLYVTGTNKLFLHIPNTVTETTTGSNFSTPVDVTAGFGGSIDFTTAEWADSANPPERFATILKTSGGGPIRGFLMGYSHLVGLGVPATRAASISEAVQVSSTDKIYPFALDSHFGATAIAADYHSLVGYRGYFDASVDTNITDHGVYTLGDKKYWVIDIGAALTKVWIKPPAAVLPKLVGKRISITGGGDKSSTLTLHSDVISARGVLVTTTGTHSWMRAEIS